MFGECRGGVWGAGDGCGRGKEEGKLLVWEGRSFLGSLGILYCRPRKGKKKDELTKEDKRERSKAWKEEGIKVCIELIQQLREIEGVAGTHIMAIEWEEAVKPIVEGAGLFPRPEVGSDQPISQEASDG